MRILPTLSVFCAAAEGRHCFFYSVAQHCLNCAREAKARKWPESNVLACLLHDASEAHISDIIRPVKAHLSNYLEIEEQIMQVIWKRFGLDDRTKEEHSMWKQIDNEFFPRNFLPFFPARRGIKIRILSVPNLAYKPFAKIEQDFLDMAKALGV